MPESKKRRNAKTFRPRAMTSIAENPEQLPWLRDFNGEIHTPRDLGRLVADGAESFIALSDFTSRIGADGHRDFPYTSKALWHALSILDQAVVGWINSGVKNPHDTRGPMAPAFEILNRFTHEYGAETRHMIRTRSTRTPTNPYEMALPPVCAFYNTLRTPALVLPTGIAHEVMSTTSGDTTDITKLKLPFYRTTLWFDEAIQMSEAHIRSATTLSRRTAEQFQLRYRGTHYINADAADTFDTVDGVSLRRAPDGTLDPVITLLAWDSAGKTKPHQMSVSRQIYLDLRVDTQLIPSITNLLALVEPRYWTQRNVTANPDTTGVANRSPDEQEPTQKDYGVRFYELDSTAMTKARRSLPGGHLMPEYTRGEHARRQRIGSRQDEIIRYVIVRVEQQRVNKGKDRPVSDHSRYYTFPESRNPVEWNGFTEGTFITADTSQPSGFREIEPPLEYLQRKGIAPLEL